MKSFLQFVRTTLSGGILFLLPLVLLMGIFNKAHEMFLKISKPLIGKLPNLIGNFDLHNLIAILILVSVCFISGLLFKLQLTKRWVKRLEENVLSYLPGYNLLKSIVAGAVGEEIEHGLSTVLVYNPDEQAWGIGFLVEEGNGLCTVFIPEAPRHDSGDVKIVPAANVKKVQVSSYKAAKSLKSYGKGALQWLRNE